ncbi:MAG: ABC transporter permease subunit [Planctomycetota bacterium]
MWQYLVKRLFLLLVTLFGICIITFLLVTLAPGDPAATYMGVQQVGSAKGRATDTVLKNARETLYLDRPVILNTTPNSRARIARKRVKELSEGTDYARQDAQEAIVGGIGTAALDIFIDEAQARAQQGVEPATKLAVAVAALETVAANASATAVELDAAVKTVKTLVPGRGPRVSGRASSADAAKAWVTWGKNHLDEPFQGVNALLDTLARLVPPDKDGPAAKGTPVERAKVWAQWWEQHKARFDPATVDKAVAAYMSAPEAQQKARLAELEKLGAVCIAPLMAIYQSSTGEQHRLAAFAISLIAHNTNDLTPRQTHRDEFAAEWADKKIGGDKEKYVDAQIAKMLEDQETKLSRWWFRSEEEFVEFSTVRQMGRGFTQTQFGNWFRQLVKLDFGTSLAHRKNNLDLIKERFPRSAWLNFFSMMLTYLIAIPIGVYSATNQRSVGDRISTIGLFVLYSLPSFWVGSILIMLLTGPPTGVDLFPSRGYEDMNAASFDSWARFKDWVWHITLPVLCLTYGGIAYVSRQMRAGMLEVIRQDYIRTARAKGLAEKVVVFKHAMRNSLIPIITLMAFLLPHMFGGSVIIESIFSIDGLGKLLFEAINQRDLPLIMTEVVIAGVLTLIGILLADIMYAIVDPRIELK